MSFKIDIKNISNCSCQKHLIIMILNPFDMTFIQHLLEAYKINLT